MNIVEYIGVDKQEKLHQADKFLLKIDNNIIGECNNSSIVIDEENKVFTFELFLTDDSSHTIHISNFLCILEDFIAGFKSKEKDYVFYNVLAAKNTLSIFGCTLKYVRVVSEKQLVLTLSYNNQ